MEELTLYFIANQKPNAASFTADSCFVSVLSLPTEVLFIKSVATCFSSAKNLNQLWVWLKQNGPQIS